MRQCNNRMCAFNNTIRAEKCEGCGKGQLIKEKSANFAWLDQPESLQGKSDAVIINETKQISWPLYPDFRLSGKYNGESTPAARWLYRLQYDFRCAGISAPSPTHIVMAIDLLAQGKVAAFIDSSYRALCDQSSHSSADLKELESALKNEFPRISARFFGQRRRIPANKAEIPRRAGLQECGSESSAWWY